MRLNSYFEFESQNHSLLVPCVYTYFWLARLHVLNVVESRNLKIEYFAPIGPEVQEPYSHWLLASLCQVSSPNKEVIFILRGKIRRVTTLGVPLVLKGIL